MQSETTKRAGLPSLGPTLVAALTIGAAVTAIAQPLTYRPTPLAAAPSKAPAIEAATLRLTMPRPALFAPAATHHEVAAPKLAALPLEPDTAVTAPAAAPSPVSPTPAPLAAAATKVQAAPLGTTARIAPVIRTAPPQVAVDRLAAAKGRDMATYSPTRHMVTESAGKPQTMSMLGDEDWASLTRSQAAAQTATSTDRSAALQPSRKGARAPIGATAIDPAADDRPSASDDADQRIDSVSLNVATKLNGVAAGRVSLLIRDDENISVRLADLLAVIEPAIEPDLYARLSASQAAQGYVTLNALRAAGIAVRFDDRDRLVIGTH